MLQNVYNYSREIYRAKRIKVWVMPQYRKASQDDIREKRLRELKKIFIQEGADESLIEEETLDEKKAIVLIERLRELFCIVTIESVPYIGNASALAENAIRLDTVVYLASGIPISINFRTYLGLEKLPEIDQITGSNLQQHASTGEFELLGDYTVKADRLKDFAFLVPIQAGKSEKQMMIYRSDSTGKTWKLIEHNGKISIGKLNALQIPVEANGIYRIGYRPREMEQTFVLCMPKMMGLTFAEIKREDGIVIPGKIVLGGTSLAFQIADDIERYTLRLKVICNDGQVFERSEIPLKACLTNRVSDTKLASHSSLRKFQGFTAPDCKYILQPDIFQNNIVNR